MGCTSCGTQTPEEKKQSKKEYKEQAQKRIRDRRKRTMQLLEKIRRNARKKR